MKKSPSISWLSLSRSSRTFFFYFYILHYTLHFSTYLPDEPIYYPCSFCFSIPLLDELISYHMALGFLYLLHYIRATRSGILYFSIYLAVNSSLKETKSSPFTPTTRKIDSHTNYLLSHMWYQRHTSIDFIFNFSDTRI